MLQEEVRASGATGTVCQATGPYSSERNKAMVVFISKGEKFPNDPVDGRSTTWYMVRSS